MKKRLILMFIFLIIGITTFTASPYEVEWTCPLDKEKFTEMYTDIEVGIKKFPVCPTCKFIIYKEDFSEKELEKYRELVKTNKYQNTENNIQRWAILLEESGLYSDFRVGLMNSLGTELDLMLPNILFSIKYLEKSLEEYEKKLLDEKNKLKDLKAIKTTNVIEIESSKKDIEFYKERIKYAKKDYQRHLSKKDEKIKALKQDNNLKEKYKEINKTFEKIIKDNFKTTEIAEKNENKKEHNKLVISKLIIANSYRRLSDYKEAEKIINEVSKLNLTEEEKKIFEELKMIIANKDNVATAEELSRIVYDLTYESFGVSDEFGNKLSRSLAN